MKSKGDLKKGAPPKKRWTRAQKAVFWAAFWTTLTCWTTPWTLVGFPALLLLVVPGLVCWFIGGLPIACLLSWYYCDDPWVKNNSRDYSTLLAKLDERAAKGQFYNPDAHS